MLRQTNIVSNPVCNNPKKQVVVPEEETPNVVWLTSRSNHPGIDFVHESLSPDQASLCAP